MTPMDAALATQIVNGGAVVALVMLVIYVLRQSQEREKTMRESFAVREEKFVTAIEKANNEFVTALSKAIGDVSWGKFIETLTYKAEWNDKQVIHIKRFYPSSKTCNVCGYVKQDLTLKDRNWICPKCGESHDRDINAAINILSEGCRNNIKETSVGTTDYDRGAKIRPDFCLAQALKRLKRRVKPRNHYSVVVVHITNLSYNGREEKL